MSTPSESLNQPESNSNLDPATNDPATNEAATNDPAVQAVQDGAADEAENSIPVGGAPEEAAHEAAAHTEAPTDTEGADDTEAEAEQTPGESDTPAPTAEASEEPAREPAEETPTESASEESAHEESTSETAQAASQETSGSESSGGEPAEESESGGDEDYQGAVHEPDGPVSQDFDRTWQRIEEAFSGKRPLSALVVDRVKGGLLVDIGVQGFVPASQVAPGKIHDLEKYVGRTLKLRITDLDRERQRVVLSARIVQEEDHAKKKKDTLGQLKVGLIAEGVVRRLTDFGAFVDIGGIDGLLHVSEMSWSRVKHPKEVVSPGDHIKVKVLKISDDKKKISLGMRQLLPDPWNTIETRHKVGEMVTGKVVRVVPFGAFVQIMDGIEAILPNSEVSSRKPKPEELPQVGDSITARVIELRSESRRMTLSIRRIQEDQERKEYQTHVESQPSKKTTIGDLFGDILSDWQDERDQPESGK